MVYRLGLISVMAAAAMAVAACEQKPAEAPPAETAETNTPAIANAVDPAAVAEGSPTGGKCGGFAGLKCSVAGDFCKTAIGQCEVADAEGTCTTLPPQDICTREYDPVCGCDGKDYPNPCQADVAGVNVQAKGKCPKPS
jgi:hypothetical protein